LWWGSEVVPYFKFIWTDEIIEHLAEHGISQDDFEHIVCHPESKGLSRSTELPVAWGHTADGRIYNGGVRADRCRDGFADYGL
jgi:hypothetical protein